MKSNTFTDHDAAGYTFGIVRARFNSEVTEGLLGGARRALTAAGAAPDAIAAHEVPGSYDIPFGVHVVQRSAPDAIICLGAIIKGETSHDAHIATAVFGELLRLEHEYQLPLALGIITANTLEQAQARSADDEANVGYQAARAAIELATLNHSA